MSTRDTYIIITSQVIKKPRYKNYEIEVHTLKPKLASDNENKVPHKTMKNRWFNSVHLLLLFVVYSERSGQEPVHKIQFVHQASQDYE